MWESMEAVGQPELGEQLEGGRVNGVATEVAVEVGMRFEEDDRDAAAGEQQAEHGPSRAGPHDAAAGLGLGSQVACFWIPIHRVPLQDMEWVLSALLTAMLNVPSSSFENPTSPQSLGGHSLTSVGGR